ncbi:hypothetical protein M408DRAFT_328361 [Serendipita vermifera MAFF 305830]|uniref:T6SS Phospholipase effector Tle1-like catalytic domain-containing protein n=1 Tax=Serendipita vermifera MAFF 305830 TaxID=933852 RepID=A0A0C2WW15_SERVB|nr:hypothetical protein M408DRAFT_328361 [Serendipita vermifera MAFF 305830]
MPHNMSSDHPDPRTLFRKRLIVCCDGTGQSSSTGRAEVPTNVSRLVQALKTSHIRPKHTESGTLKIDRGVEEVPQIVLYQTGIGATGVTKFSKGLASAFGIGVDEHILEAYCFIANNFEDGDELFLFGFSRGAFTARAVASLMCNAGLLKKESLGYLPKIYAEYKLRREDDASKAKFENWWNNERYKFQFHDNVVITILGVWDTVSSIGIPQTWLSTASGLDWLRKRYNASYAYHDTSLPGKRDHKKKDPRAYVHRAFQALSLEENRTSFEPILLRFPKQINEKPEHGPEFQQCWFPGVHTDVGGGYERDYRDLSDISFAWMVDMCWPYLNFQQLSEILKRPTLIQNDKEKSIEASMVEKLPEDKPWALTAAHDELKKSLMFFLGGWTARKPKQYYLDQRFGPDGERFPDGQRVVTHEYIHASVRRRMMHSPNEDGSPWQPPSLDGFILEKDGDKWKWVKTIKVKGKWQSIAIREWTPGDACTCEGASEERALLDRDVWDALRDEEAVKRIKFVNLKSRMWLRVLGLTIIVGAAVAWYVHSKHPGSNWLSHPPVPLPSFLYRYTVNF